MKSNLSSQRFTAFKNAVTIILLLLFTVISPSVLKAGTPGKIIWNYDFTRVNSAYMSRVTVSANMVVVPLGTEDMICLDLNTGKEIWKNPTSNPNTNTTKPAAFTLNNRIYTSENVSYTKGIMKCLDLNTGSLIWQFQTPQGENADIKYGRKQINCTPVVKNGKVYFHDFQGVIYCLDASNGSLIWKNDINVTLNRKKTESWKPDAYEYQGPIMVEGNSVFAVCTNRQLVCLNVSDGSKKWIKEFKGWRETDISLLGAFGGRVYALYAPWKKGASTETHNLIAIDSQTGKEIWKSPRLKGTYSRDLRVLNGNLMLTGGNALYGSAWNKSYLTFIDINTGRIISRKDLPFDIRSQAEFAEGKRYYIRWDFHGKGSTSTFSTLLYCDDAATGRNLWKTALIKNSNDWYYTGRTPKSRATSLLVERGLAFVTINNQLWCIQTGESGN